MKIAIIDILNQDLGIKIIFPEAEYFVFYDEFDKDKGLKRYNINKRYDIENINDKNFDYLFIIIPLLNTTEAHYYDKIAIAYDKVLCIINENNFKKICLFDNYDYDYDPSLYAKTDKIDIFFKRNYSSIIDYKPNVFPFNFFSFGYYSFMELIEEKKRLENPNRENRIYFSGTLFNHSDDEFKVYRNRNIIFNQIYNYLYLPNYMNNVPLDDYLNDIHNSKFSLDLNGVGDPNRRTFEIISQGSLKLGEFNNLKWCFNDNFCEETIFKDSQDFISKITKLIENPDLYKKCLDKQNEIVEKYFNKHYLRNYLLEIIEK
jgi:hypothetical protein